MRRIQNQQELEEKLIAEEYDPITLEERAEDEQILLEETDSESSRIQLH